jgi:DNA-binding transcriptional LysR family regulator
LDINRWLIFAHIVDFGGLSEASRRLGLPKSTLSRHLANLEAETGVRLLNRQGRTLKLTDAGQLLYEESRQIAALVANASERLKDQTAREGGTIRMTAPKTPGGLFLGAWLAKFLQAHPDIRIELDLDDRMLNLHEHAYDIALRVGPLQDSSLLARPLARSARWLVATPDYLARHGRPESPEQLETLPCIGFGEQRSGHGVWTLERGKRTRQVRYKPVLRCDDMATSLQVCLNGAGIALIPAFVCQDALAAGELERVLPAWQGQPAQFYLVYAERKLLPKRVRWLIEHLVECGKTVAW